MKLTSKEALDLLNENISDFIECSRGSDGK